MLRSNLRAGSTASAFLALSCFGLTATPLAAQTAPAKEDEKATELQGVTVTDTAINEGSYKVDRQDSPKSTASILNTPRSITVIPAQVIKDTASATLTEALRTVPGITLGSGEGGNPLGDRPFIRGFDSQPSTYLDGVRDIGAQSREVFAVEQIEVVKGSDSVTGGRGNPGGAINLVSKLPTSDRFAAASGVYGNADYKRATVDVNQPLNELIGVRLEAMYHDQGVAGRDALYQKRWGVAPSIKIGLTGPTSLTLAYYHLHTSELPDSGIPYLYTINNAPAGVTETSPARNFTTIAGRQISTPRDAFYGLKDRDFRKTNVDEFTIRASHEFANGMTIRNTSRYGHAEQNYIWTQPDDSQGNVYGTNPAAPGTAGGYVWRRINNRNGYAEGVINQTDLYGKLHTGPLEHSFAGTLEISMERAAYGTYVSNPALGTAIATGSTITPRCTPANIARFNCTTIDNPNPSDPWVSYASDTSTALAAIQKSLPQTRTVTTINTKAASLFDTIAVGDHVLVNLGGRYDHYQTRVGAGVAATSTAGRTFIGRTDDLWTYQAGLVYKPVESASIYASTSTAATPPGSFLGQGSDTNGVVTTSQISTDDLKIERTRSYEVGAKWNLFDNALALNLALFQTKTRNARTTGENNTVVYIGKRRTRGIEFGFNGNITPEWNVFGGYSYLDSIITNGGLTTTTVNGVNYSAPAATTGKRFPNTPKHSITAFTTYKILPALTVGGGAIYNSKVYGGYADLRSVTNGQVVVTKTLARMVPSYWRFDANAAYQITDNIGVQLNALNLTNKRYYDRAYASHYANQAAGRTILGTLSIRY